MLKVRSLILLRAAVSVTAPEGTNGKILSRMTRIMADIPPVFFNLPRNLSSKCWILE